MSNGIRVAGIWTTTMIVLLSAGCGGSGIVPVSGDVVFEGRDDRPKVCRLTFVPKDTADGIRPNGAEMRPDGSYRMTEFKGVRGLFPGRYAVRVSYFELKPGGDPNSENGWNEFKHEGEELVIETGSSAVKYDVTIPAR